MYSLPRVYHKLHTNTRLTSIEEDKVRRSKRKALIKLKAIESETALSILRRKWKETEDYINVRQKLTSPIRRLSPEILQEIFWRCLPTAHNSVLSFKEAPLLLGRVCSQWHQIAYSTPKLWSSLHIVVVPLTPPSPPTEARLEAFDAWLARSGVLPLYISMAPASRVWTWSHGFRPYFDLIANYARRLKSIHLQVDLYDPLNTLMGIYGSDFPLLETLHVLRFMHQNTENRLLSDEDGILSAPLLRVLSVQEISLCLLDLPIQWSQLTGLDFIPRASEVSDILELLTLCSNLETCSMNFPDSVGSSVSAPSDIRPKVILLKLQTLRIYGELDSHHGSLILLNNLSTPALRHFAYQNLVSPYTPWTTIVFTEPSLSLEILRSFFQRLNEPLEELNLSSDGLETRYLMELLSLFPGLKRLSLGSASLSSMSSVNDSLLLGFIPYEHKRHCRSCALALDEEMADESPDSVIPSLRCLCPKLEVFDMDDAIFSRHVLFEFLRSRLVGYDLHNLVRLRRFAISFDLTLDDRITTEEIDRLAEESGMVEMRLSQRRAVHVPSIWGGLDFA